VKVKKQRSNFKMKVSILLINLIFDLIFLVGKSPVVCQPDKIDTQSDGDVEDLDLVPVPEPVKEETDDEKKSTSSPDEEIKEEKEEEHEPEHEPEPEPEPVQSGPLIDLLGTKLHSLEINADEQSARVKEHFTNEVLDGKKVIGLYFSADWCGPCRQFTPELVSFYDRMNKRRGQKDHFQIVMISRCRDVDSHYQYFSQMPWLAMPLDEAAGQRGQQLGEKYGVQGIPSLVLVDDLGQTITTDARSKIPADKAGIGFPWRNPLSQLYNTLVPRSLRMIVKLQVDTVRTKFVQKVKKLVGLRRK